MAKREENERLLQAKIEQLQRDMERMRQNPVTVTTVQPVITTIPPRAQTPVERYVVTETRPKVMHFILLHLESPFFSLLHLRLYQKILLAEHQ